MDAPLNDWGRQARGGRLRRGTVAGFGRRASESPQRAGSRTPRGPIQGGADRRRRVPHRRGEQPRSGRNRRSPALVQKLTAVLDGDGEVVEPADLPELEQAIRRFRDQGVDVIGVNGGDGTLHKVLSALVVVYADGAGDAELRAVKLPRIAILKGEPSTRWRAIWGNGSEGRRFCRRYRRR